MFSILIPSYNNLEYLKLCIKSIIKNSKFKHQIIIHVNEGTDGTLDFLKYSNIEFTYTQYNAGVSEGVNKASKLAKHDYFLYSHDDFYFCPNWDEYLFDEINLIGHNNFYLSGTMMNNGQIPFQCGDNIKNFNEKKFLSRYKNFNYYNFNGSTWSPALVHKNIWNKVDGFSEEFFPGHGSDPDFNMKLWNLGVRIFKGINNCKVYHFGSITLRNKMDIIKKDNNYGSVGSKIFLLKWGISIKFFKKFYLKSDSQYIEPLKEPTKNIFFYIALFKCKINLLYLKLFHQNL